MSNLLKTELYKLFHSWYFWGIGIFNLLLSSILLLDSKERSSTKITSNEQCYKHYTQKIE
jgi:hypothetical protein